MSTEEVYDLLPVSQTNQKVPGFGEDLLPPSEDAALEQDIQDILIRASIQSQMSKDKPGTIPGDIQIFLNGLLNPKLPWNQILRKYLNAMAKNDYSFRRLNRRFFPKHYIPSLYGEKLMNITVAVDTSGSVSDAEFKRFVSETHAIMKVMKPDQITVIQFDTDIKSIDKVTSTKALMDIKFTGRGGTCMNPVMSWVNENKPQMLMVFTDGYFSTPNEQAKCNTIWLIHNNPSFKSQFGKVIHYEV